PPSYHPRRHLQYYSLKQLVTLLEHAEAPMVTYIAACTRKDVKWVASIEKADVLAYLRGQTDSAAQVRISGLMLSFAV
ncbi:unnamed protein product, partial [Laminaria digitata]